MEFRIKDDLKTIREIMSLSQKELATNIGIDALSITRIENGDVVPSFDSLEKIYDFAYCHGVHLNKLKAMFHSEAIFSNHEVLFFGAKKDIQGKLNYSYSRASNDLGVGFYLYEDLNSATSFISKVPDSCVYIFYFQKDGESLHYKLDQDWLLTVAYHRGLLPKYKDHPHLKELLEKEEKADYITAPSFDNRAFYYLEQFSQRDITDEQCLAMLKECHPSKQYILKSDRALKNISMLEKCYISSTEKIDRIHLKEDVTNDIRNAKKENVGKGKYLNEILL